MMAYCITAAVLLCSECDTPCCVAHEIVLARAIEGEGAELFGSKRDEVGLWIARTAINRWQMAWWREVSGTPISFSKRVELDWHGAGRISNPQPWSLAIAREALYGNKAALPPEMSESLFAMSYEDIENNGWWIGALEHKIKVFTSESTGHQYWFLSDFPGKEEENGGIEESSSPLLCEQLHCGNQWNKLRIPIIRK